MTCERLLLLPHYHKEVLILYTPNHVQIVVLKEKKHTNSYKIRKYYSKFGAFGLDFRKKLI